MLRLALNVALVSPQTFGDCARRARPRGGERPRIRLPSALRCLSRAPLGAPATCLISASARSAPRLTWDTPTRSSGLLRLLCSLRPRFSPPPPPIPVHPSICVSSLVALSLFQFVVLILNLRVISPQKIVPLHGQIRSYARAFSMLLWRSHHPGLFIVRCGEPTPRHTQAKKIKPSSAAK